MKFLQNQLLTFFNNWFKSGNPAAKNIRICNSTYADYFTDFSFLMAVSFSQQFFIALNSST
jgi:hypothetical protein